MTKKQSSSELAKQVQQLFEQENYDHLIRILTKKLLDQRQDPELYGWRAYAHYRKKEKVDFNAWSEKSKSIEPTHWMSCFLQAIIHREKLDLDIAIDKFNEVIRLKPDFHFSWNARGNAFEEQNEYDKAIADFNEAIQLKPDNYYPWNGRGNAWVGKSEYDKAILDYNQAIQLKSDYHNAWQGRAFAYLKKSEYDKAIADYNIAIRLKSDNSKIWHNRGFCYLLIQDYNKAIADYNEAILLNTTDANTWNSRGTAWLEMSEFEQALADFDKCIELNPQTTFAYRNRGRTFEAWKKPIEAIEAYKIAIEIHPNDERSANRLHAIQAQEGIDFDYEDNAIFSTIDLMYEFTNRLEQIDRRQIRQQYTRKISPAIDAIRNIAKHVDAAWQENYGEEGKGIKHVAHYTNLRIADLLINLRGSDSFEHNSKMRYSNAVFMNDPEEGRLLAEALNDLESKNYSKKELIKKAYTQVHQNKSHFYLGSFMPVDQGHEDELLMWRTYGKDHQQNEAAGCSLVIDCDFFDPHNTDKDVDIGMAKTKSEAQPLYRVLYYDKRKRQFVNDDDDKITTAVGQLMEALRDLLQYKTECKKKGYREKLQQTLAQVAHHALSEIRFFFKSADYAYENELRVVVFNAQTATISSEESLPRKMYIESGKPLKPHLLKLVVGPKVPYPDRWMYLEEQMRRDHPERGFELVYSRVSFQ